MPPAQVTPVVKDGTPTRSDDLAWLDPRCLVTTEAVVIDGANGVCGARRTERFDVHARSPLFLALLIVTLLSLVWRTGLKLPVGALPRCWRARLRLVVLSGLLLAGVPGTYAVCAVRGDRPAARASMAAIVQRALETLERRRRDTGCLGEPVGSCVACVPLVRLSTVGSLPCDFEMPLERTLFQAGP